jgi:hypothetical protein
MLEAGERANGLGDVEVAEPVRSLVQVTDAASLTPRAR